MNAKISLFVVCIEAIIYLLLYNLRDCTFKPGSLENRNIFMMFRYDLNKFMTILKVL